MPKQIKKTVDDTLPKWLHSKFLSAVDFIWQGKQESMEESVRRIKSVDDSGVFTDEEMSWVMMLLTIPKLQTIIESSEDWIAFKRQKEKEKKESVH
jgi:isocitrate dehydrogenase kinase/phosphatase